MWQTNAPKYIATKVDNYSETHCVKETSFVFANCFFMESACALATLITSEMMRMLLSFTDSPVGREITVSDI